MNIYEKIKLRALKDDFLDSTEFPSHVFKVISTSWEIHIEDNNFFLCQVDVHKDFLYWKLLVIFVNFCCCCLFCILLIFLFFLKYSVLRSFISHCFWRIFYKICNTGWHTLSGKFQLFESRMVMNWFTRLYSNLYRYIKLIYQTLFGGRFFEYKSVKLPWLLSLRLFSGI